MPAKALVALKQKSTTESITYEIAYTGEEALDLVPGQSIQITLVDGEFQHVTFPFKNPYTKNQWAVMSAIDSEIKRLETMKAGG